MRFSEFCKSLPNHILLSDEELMSGNFESVRNPMNFTANVFTFWVTQPGAPGYGRSDMRYILPEEEQRILIQNN